MANEAVKSGDVFLNISDLNDRWNKMALRLSKDDTTKPPCRDDQSHDDSRERRKLVTTLPED